MWSPVGPHYCLIRLRLNGVLLCEADRLRLYRRLRQSHYGCA